MRVGERVALKIQRGTRELEVNVTVADLPEIGAPKVQVLTEIELVTLTPAIRAERAIGSRQGALVFRVSERVERELGIRAGDVIVQVNREPIEDADAAARALDYFGDRGTIRLWLERAGSVYYTDFTIRRK